MNQAEIALIDDPGVVRRILEHLGHWAPEPAGRGPPAQSQNGYGKSALTDLSSGGGEWATFIIIDTVVK